MKLTPEISAIVIASIAAFSFGGGFALGDWRMNSRLERITSESTVTKLDGYASRNKKYGFVTHFNDYDKERSEKMIRDFNKDNWVKQEPFDSELVELFYRKVK